MDAFWAKGFEATSMAELCTCTGMHKGSLYQAFGDKHQLFMTALKHYADSEFRETTAGGEGIEFAAGKHPSRGQPDLRGRWGRERLHDDQLDG